SFPTRRSSDLELFDLLQKHFERGLVRGVARQHFVGQRKTFGRHDQSDDHLHAIKTFVPAVAKLTFVAFSKRWIALTVSRGQIVEQHVVGDAKKAFPALLQKAEQRLLVRQ